MIAMKSAAPPHTRSVAILGQLPPPFGGVSVHLSRLVDRLSHENVPYRFYEMTGKDDPARNIVPAAKSAKWMVPHLLRTREPFTHLHAARVPATMFTTLALTARGRGVIVTLHNNLPKRWYQSANPVMRRLWLSAAQRMSHIFCANRDIRDWLLELGIASDRVTHSPAFIPTSPHELDDSNLSDDIKRFLDRHSPIIASHGWFGEFQDGCHIYSFDMLAGLLDQARRDWPRAGLITAVSGTFEPAHREQILDLRRTLGLEDQWLILEKPFSAPALYARSDVFVRPTVTDGDSVSIRECLAMGVPVVASDAVARPAGCVLFRNRDLAEFGQAVRDVLQDPDPHRRRAREAPVIDASHEVIAVYRRLLQS